MRATLSCHDVLLVWLVTIFELSAYLSGVATFEVTKETLMPHRWSAEKLAARRAIALERGFLRPCPKGVKHVAVPEVIAHRVKRMAQGVEETRKTELALGVHCRTFSGLLQASEGRLPAEKHAGLRRTLHLANSAKHRAFKATESCPQSRAPGCSSWADAWSDDDAGEGGSPELRMTVEDGFNERNVVDSTS